MLDKKTIRRHFERATGSYDASAVLQKEIARRLDERLDYIKIDPARILDVGCGTGFMTEKMFERYKRTSIVALDISLGMARQSRKKGGWFRKPLAICADAEKLPLKAGSIDLIISNLMLQWSNDLHAVFQGFHSSLAANGMLLFSSFGPDTLKEIRTCWKEIDPTPHTSEFADMHEIGDALLQAGFINPVTDMEMISMTYDSVEQLMRDIKRIGATNSHNDRNRGLLGKGKYAAFKQAYDQFRDENGRYIATWEIIYGHAWVGEGFKSSGFEKMIPIRPV